jgi:hypothetical protein
MGIDPLTIVLALDAERSRGVAELEEVSLLLCAVGSDGLRRLCLAVTTLGGLRLV